MTHVQNHANRLAARVPKVEFLETADRAARRRRLDDIRGDFELSAGGFVERFERLARDCRVDNVVGLVLVVLYDDRNVERVMASSDGVDLDSMRWQEGNLPAGADSSVPQPRECHP